MPLIKLWSDIHLEFSNHKYDHIWVPSDDDKDTILVLAGDVDIGLQNIKFVDDVCSSFKHVIRICGNHEFYHNDFNSVINGWTEFEEGGPKNFHFLHNDWRILDGVRFLGGTMWTSFDDGDPLVMMIARNNMSDYDEIKHNGNLIIPAFILTEHDKFIKFLLTEFDKPFDGDTVVITHHSPGNCLKRTGRKPWGSDFCYYADMEEMIGHHDIAKLWLHGHTHRNHDYMINNTRVICNPFGYFDEGENAGFNKNLIIEI